MNPRTVIETAEAGAFEVSISDPIKAEVEGILVEKFLGRNSASEMRPTISGRWLIR
ncbi:MAG: hypothetical protein LAP38_04480 [Acidobacteriia bacterium]|nr:hypothetical protein [Terriglobia bacterium]